MNRRARNRRFPTEFKRALCVSVREGRIGRREAERLHNLSCKLLATWLAKYDEGLLEPGGPVTPSARQYEQRIADLERMVGRLTMEADRLQQALDRTLIGNDDSVPEPVSATDEGLDQAAA